MKKIIISSPNAPQAVGPYSQGIRMGDFVFLAGQIPLDPATKQLVDGDITVQTERALANIKALLESQGYSLSDVVKATVFMVDLQDFKAMNEVYARHFTSEHPARSTIQVAALPLGSKVEIEVIAHRQSA